MNLKVAILHQSKIPPAVDGVTKPMKEGGYSDSGADIAVGLQRQSIEVITPSGLPNINNDFDWVFPDNEEGIQNAFRKGANLFWLNTVLYGAHPILKFRNKRIHIVGQDPKQVERFDDKFYTNEFLKKQSLPIASSFLITAEEDIRKVINFPLVLKPVRGRGSQGVVVVQSEKEFKDAFLQLTSSKKYGSKIIVEEFLPGKEITVTVMPPGKYTVNGKNLKKESYWALPVVKRFNHIEGIAPYNGVVAVVNNSQILPDQQQNAKEIKEISKQCELASEIIRAKAPIRIDCRKSKNGDYKLFDLNMKPNMTGASRPHRKDQDSLTMIAAKGIEWTYVDLITNMLTQHWKL